MKTAKNYDGSKHPLLPGFGSKDAAHSGSSFIMETELVLLNKQLTDRFDPGNHNGDQKPENPYESEGEPQTRQFGDVSDYGRAHQKTQKTDA